eukprot:13218341-Alexandrium_andersonii.AAC.1
MSASLVGSEMCIRDSQRGTLDRLKTQLMRVGRPTFAAARPSMGNFRAVSYTHLTLPTICSV